MKEKKGFCNTKTTLFIAMLRAAKKTDSYIVDSDLFKSAQKALEERQTKIGLGTVLGASSEWDGQSNHLVNFYRSS